MLHDASVPSPAMKDPKVLVTVLRPILCDGVARAVGDTVSIGKSDAQCLQHAGTVLILPAGVS